MADDEDDDDEEEHHGDGVIATLVRRDGVVTLSRFPDPLEDEAVQHDQDQHRDEDKRDGVCDEDVVARVRRVFSQVGRNQPRAKHLPDGVVVESLVEVGQVGWLQLAAELEEPGYVEDERAGHDGQGVGQVIVVVAVGLKRKDNKLLV